MSEQGNTRSRLREISQQFPWAGPFVALLLVYAVFYAMRPDTFGRPTTVVTMALHTVVVAIAAVGTTMVIVQGGIDLSIGSTVALTTVVVAYRLKAGAGPLPAAITGVAVATACGAIVGALVTGLRMAPFIVTLGAMSIVRGAAKGLANEQKIDVEARGLDALMAPLSDGKRWLLFPPGIWITIVIAVLVAAALRYTRFGRHVFAIGSNEQTARLCGVPVDRVKIAVYTLSAGLTGIAGILMFSGLTVGDPTVAVGLELDVIAAVVIGGGSLSGGEGSIVGALVGAALMTVIKDGATHVGLPNWVQEIVTGVIIVVAVALDRFRQARR